MIHVGPRTLSAAVIAAAAFFASGTALAQSETCAAATLIGVGTYSGTTAGATNDGDGGCGSTASTPDVWYKYIAPASQQLIVTTCSLAGWDTVLSLHSGCPGNSTNALACNDDNCGVQSRITATLVAGQTYYIRVGGYNGATGPFSIDVSVAAPPPPPTRGPDVAYYATENNIAAYAVGTDACNKGDAPAEWQSSNNRHPVIAQNLYRLKGGRFEQIGQSWLKHGFASTNSAACGTCQVPPNGGAQLGPSCSDAYGSGLNGSQSNLGPRSQVNPTTGVFTYPVSAPSYTGNIARRIQVPVVDVNPTLNTGAIYFAECQYITQDDAQWGNGLNNASYKRVNMASYTAPAWAAATVREQNAIRAWAANDTGVTVSNIDYPEAGVTAGSTITGRFIVASKATNMGNGKWSYEYAVQNVNSNRAAGEFRLSLPPGANISDVGFHDVASHSGEPYDGTDWPGVVGAYDITWKTTPYGTNVNANAIRWGTMYNFRFTADVAPTTGQVMLGLFKPATGSLPQVILGDAVVPDPTVCIGDFNRDGGFDGADVVAFFQAWEAGASAADANNDGGVDGADAQAFYQAWESSSC
jgi:hypothetical protein